MDDPVSEIPFVIKTITQASPSAQQHAIETYFTPTASFTHPFCRTGSYPGSRTVMMYIYRWYKILSPHIDMQVDSVAFDKQAMLLYVSLHQIFSIQFLPFHRSHVSLTTVLHLTKVITFPLPTNTGHEVKASQRTEGRAKYYITSQNDLYQTSEFVKFVIPWFGLGTSWVMLWQFVATTLCIVGAVLGWPAMWFQENFFSGNSEQRIRDIVGTE